MELDRIRHAAHCAQWLQHTVLGLSGSQERLSAMTPLLLRLGRHDGSPNTVLKMLEEVRRVAVVEAERVFEPRRRQAIERALPRLRSAQLQAALLQAARIDRMIKGIAPGEVWDEFLQLMLRLRVRA